MSDKLGCAVCQEILRNTATIEYRCNIILNADIYSAGIEMYYFHEFQKFMAYFSPADEGSMFSQNVGIYLHVHAVLQPSKINISHLSFHLFKCSFQESLLATIMYKFTAQRKDKNLLLAL
jgi:hypothetical protein